MKWLTIFQMPIQTWFNRDAQIEWLENRDRMARAQKAEELSETIARAKAIVNAYGIDPVYHNPRMALPHHVKDLQEAVQTLTDSGYLMKDKFGRVVGLDDRFLGEVRDNPVRKSDLEAQFRRSQFKVVPISGAPESKKSSTGC